MISWNFTKYLTACNQRKSSKSFLKTSALRKRLQI